MRIAFDATPAAVQRAGVGRYARELLRALLELPGDDTYTLLTAATAPELRKLLDELPPGLPRDVVRIPLSPRLLNIVWNRVRLPLRAELLTGPFDVVHGPDFVIPPSREPRVVTIHDLSFRVVPQYGDPGLVAFLSTAVPRALRQAERVIAVSASVAAEVMSEYPFVSDRVVAIPNGVRLPTTTPAAVAPVSRPRVLFLGTLEPRKGVETLIEAARIVRSTFPDLELVLAGRIGWQADAIVVRMREAARAGYLRHLNAPNDDEVDDAFREATLFAYPSRYEGFGLPVLEAMAHGLPVITSDISSLRETGGNAARYVPPDDPEALAAEIATLLDDAELRVSLTARGTARAASYSWRTTAQATRRVYGAAARQGPEA